MNRSWSCRSFKKFDETNRKGTRTGLRLPGSFRFLAGGKNVYGQDDADSRRLRETADFQTDAGPLRRALVTLVNVSFPL
jgi:hypothetical protein